MQTIGSPGDSVAAIAKHLAARPIPEPDKPVRLHSLADLGAAFRPAVPDPGRGDTHPARSGGTKADE